MELDNVKIIFKTLVGSQSFGTNVEGSDEDYSGVYLQYPDDVYLHGYKERIEVSKDEVYYELGKFVSLCMTANPTVLELLFAPDECIQILEPEFQKIIDIRNIFLTKKLKHSFYGYAVSQIKKAGGLEKKMNWETSKTIRKSVEDMCYVYPFDFTYEDSNVSHTKFFGENIQRVINLFSKSKQPFISSAILLDKFLTQNSLEKEFCALVRIEHFRDCYLLFYSDNNNKYRGITSSPNANDVLLSEVPKTARPIAILFFHRDAYSSHCKEYNEYQEWLKNRNTQRYVDIEGHNQKIDGKNILHCVRLIETALEIPILKKINVKRPNAEYLISIRKGKHDLKTILDKCEKDISSIDDAFNNSDLPECISKEDNKLINKIVIDIKTNIMNNFNKQ